MINGNVTWHLKGGWMMLIKLICFLIGVIVGSVGIILWTCLVVGAEADEKERQMFEKYIKEKENVGD